MHLCKGFLVLVLTVSLTACNVLQPNYFATNNYYNTPNGPVYWDEYRIFGYGNRIGAYGYRYGTPNSRVEVNFHRPSVGGAINSLYNPVFQSPPVWPPFSSPSGGATFINSPSSSAFGPPVGTRPGSRPGILPGTLPGSPLGSRPITPPGFPPGYPGGAQSYPWRPTKRPGYDYFWPQQWRSSDAAEDDEDETLDLSY